MSRMGKKEATVMRGLVAMHLAAGQRGEDTGKAQAGEDDEGHLEALHERVRVLGRHLVAPDIDGEKHVDDAHAQGHAGLAHGGHRGRGHAVQPVLDRAHDGVGVGRGEQPESEAQQSLPADD
jgi:hypothetical protein